MASWSPGTASKLFAVFAALDLGLLLVLSSEALREARQADPAGLLSVFAAMQAVAVGDIGSIAEARSIIRQSFAVEEYLPRDAARWDEAYGRFQALTKS